MVGDNKCCLEGENLRSGVLVLLRFRVWGMKETGWLEISAIMLAERDRSRRGRLVERLSGEKGFSRHPELKFPRSAKTSQSGILS